jgi:hypothetical protein
MFTFKVDGLMTALQSHEDAIRSQTRLLTIDAAEQREIEYARLRQSRRIADALEGILFLLKRASRPNRPTGLQAVFVEERMADQVIYKVVADPVADPDVVKRELVVEVGGVELSRREVGLSETELGEVAVPQDSEVTLKVVDTDDAQPAGLTSELKVVFTARDQQNPVSPSGLNVEFVREEAEVPAPPVVEEPVVEEPVAEEPVVEEPVAEAPEAPVGEAPAE